MLSWMATFRVSAALVFLGAFTIIGAIKLTSLLPSRYYFSFSRLMHGRDTPFLVEAPSVTGKQLCRLLAQHRIDRDTFGSELVKCNLNDALDANGAYPKENDADNSFTKHEIDEIFTVAASSDLNVRRALEVAIKQMSINPMSDDFLRNLLSDVKSPQKAFAEIVKSYRSQITKQLRDSIAESYAASIASKIGNSNGKGDSGRDATGPEDVPDVSGLSSAELKAIMTAHGNFANEIKSALRGIAIRPIKKSDLDYALKQASGDVSSAASSIAGFYSNQVADVVEQSLKRSFGPAAAGAQSQEEAKQAVFQQITVEGMRDYIISILIRLSPVVLFGLWGGAVLGRAELASVSLAAGFASFLLCWPLILDWDLLVQDHYQVYKNYFLAFYAIYILSFFVLARMSAMIAIWLKQELWRARFGKVSGDPQVSRVSVLELIVTMFLGITVNAATYAAAAALPSVGN